MKKLREVLFINIYSIFSIIFIIISAAFLAILKLYLNKIISSNPAVYEISNKVFWGISFFIAITLMVIFLFVFMVRQKILNFTNRMSNVIDKVINNEEDIDFEEDEESIVSKLEHKLKKLIEIVESNRSDAIEEKDNIKSLIADISHQIKTPIANITMYNDTLIQRELTKEQQILFLNNMKFQVSKLEWLVQGLIKMSRLDTNVIGLNKSKGRIKDTIANAISGVYLKAEEKNINISVKCLDNIQLNHDKKWTSEALFNILENAVKYNRDNGNIYVVVEELELFTRIDIKDTGIGIEESEINNIFKRFYRSSIVSDIEGIGIGLYLANEIITKQGGYMKVKSECGKETTFSVFFKR